MRTRMWRSGLTFCVYGLIPRFSMFARANWTEQPTEAIRAVGRARGLYLVHALRVAQQPAHGCAGDAIAL